MNTMTTLGPRTLAWCRKKARILHDDGDCVYGVDGYPGYGKSTLSIRILQAIDPTFDLSRVAFRSEQVMELAETVPRYSGIQMDETAWGAYAKESNMRANIEFEKFLNTCRDRNLAIGLVGNQLKLLPPYIREFRVLDRFWLDRKAHFKLSSRLVREHEKRPYWKTQFGGTWSDLAPETRAEYEKLKDAALRPARAGPGDRTARLATLTHRYRALRPRVLAWRPPAKRGRGRPRGPPEDILAELHRFDAR